MGTAVLYPQDCLIPQSRLKNPSPGMLCPFESVPTSKRNRPTSSGTGLLPLPVHAQNSSPMNTVRRGSGGKHVKARKAFGLRDCSPPSTAAPDLSVCRILQRPKQGDPVTELRACFAMSDKSEAEAAEGVDRCADMTAAPNGAVGVVMDAFKLKQKGLHSSLGELSAVGGGAQAGSAAHKGEESSGWADGSIVSSAEVIKHSSMKVVDSKAKNNVEGKLYSGLSAAKPVTLKAIGWNDMAVTGHQFEGQDKFLPKGWTQLRRTATEPPMVEHLVGQYTRGVMRTSISNPRLEAHAHRHQFCGSDVDMSCEERWAGPAYSSSPPPSSLPLPKLCLPHPKFTTVKLQPLIKQCSASVYTQSFLDCSTPPFVASENGGGWDAAFATKSLRRLLNLDPC